MGSKNKLKRFIENDSFQNVIQPSRDELITKKFKFLGNWNKLVEKIQHFFTKYCLFNKQYFNYYDNLDNNTDDIIKIRLKYIC